MWGILLRFVGCYFTSILAVLVAETLSTFIFPLLIELTNDFGQGAGLAWLLEVVAVLFALPLTALTFIPIALRLINSNHLGSVGATFLGIASMLPSLFIFFTMFVGGLTELDSETVFFLLHTAAGYGLIIGPMFRWLSLLSAKASSGRELGPDTLAEGIPSLNFILGLATLTVLLFAWSSIFYLQFAG